MVKAKKNDGQSTGTGKRKSIKSIKAQGLAFSETTSGATTKPKATKSKKKVVVDSSGEESSPGEGEDEEVKIE